MKTKSVPPHKRAIIAAGGPAALGRMLNISGSAVGQWQEVPADRVIDVERAIKALPWRQILRPDLYPGDDSPQP